MDDEEVHARLATLVVAEEGGEHGRVAHHDQRQQRPQQRELLRLHTPSICNKPNINKLIEQWAKKVERVDRGQRQQQQLQLHPGARRPPRATFICIATTRRRTHTCHNHTINSDRKNYIN
jgi:hypothetical protein